jgi:hypothetical protein
MVDLSEAQTAQRASLIAPYMLCALLSGRHEPARHTQASYRSAVTS